MKEHLAELVHAAPSTAQAQNVVREYLQARILGCLQRSGAMIPLAFHGGTALRLLFASPRYSEDLDFALERDDAQYDLRAYLQAVERQLAPEGYNLDITISDQRVVHSAFIRFTGLLYELGLSPHQEQVFSVKIEVDTTPPAGAVLETSLIRRHVTLHLQHHDRASLLSGKLHAILQRPYTKGRDIYDLLWFLSDPTWPAPNLKLLNNALRQTRWEGDEAKEDNWRALIRSRLEALKWDQVLADVRPFLDPTAGVELLKFDNVMRVLG